MRILHIVVTGNFAGTERYVCEVGRSCAELDDEVTVLGGDPARMRPELGDGVRWLPGASLSSVARSVLGAGRFDLCHAHLTQAEAVGVALRGVHRGRVISTRHIASHRGASRLGHQLAPWIARRLDAEIAISRFVADRLERPPTLVLHNGVRESPMLWRPESRTALVLQRLEPEKDTWTAIEGWHRSGLADLGWQLRIAGDGSERPLLERKVREQNVRGVTFAGWSQDARAELASAALLIAPAPTEPFGLSVVEAMAAGVPVIAANNGGHLETVATSRSATLFAAGEADSLADALTAWAECAPAERSAVAASLRDRQRAAFSLKGHVAQLRSLYRRVIEQPHEACLGSDGSGPRATVPQGQEA